MSDSDFRIRLAGRGAPSDMAADDYLARCLRAEIKRRGSQVRVVLTYNSRTVEQLLLDGKLEIGLITNPSHNPKIILETLRTEQVVAVVSASHPLAKKRSLSEHKLATIPVLVRLGGTIVEQLERMGAKLRIAMTYDSSEAIKAAVESGMGLGFFYRDTVDLGLRQGYLKSIDIPYLKGLQAKCFLIYLAGTALSADATDFVEVLRQSLSTSRS